MKKLDPAWRKGANGLPAHYSKKNRVAGTITKARTCMVVNWRHYPKISARTLYGRCKTTAKSRFLVDNATDWPDDLLVEICRWVLEREQVSWGYCFRFEHHSARNAWYGHGSARGQCCRVGRYADRRDPLTWRANWTDTRYARAAHHSVTDAVEALVFLIAHEACHANRGHPERFLATWRSGLMKGHQYLRTSVMERRCNQEAMGAVQAFRKVRGVLFDNVEVARQERAERLSARIAATRPEKNG